MPRTRVPLCLRSMPWFTCFLILGAGQASAQQAVWQQSVPNLYSTVWMVDGHELAPFIDIDLDGYQDLALHYSQRLHPQQGWSYRSYYVVFYSGRDGSTLGNWSSNADQSGPGVPWRHLMPAGDRDGDGREEYFASQGGSSSLRSWFTTWSRHVGSALPYVGVVARIDLDGNGRFDLLTATTAAIQAYNENAQATYAVPATTFGTNHTIQSIVAFTDVDGDGSQDYFVKSGVGAAAATLSILSGSTGAVLRVPTTPSVFYESMVTPIADVDADGVADYVVSSGGSPWTITVVSGAAGNIVRQWSGPENNRWHVATMDADADGLADVVSTSMSVIARSMRDGGTANSFSSFAWQGFALGVPAGTPYPRLATIVAFTGIGVYDWTPLGASVDGTSCSSSATHPTVGVRHVGMAMRLHTGSAPAGARAWCCLDAGVGLSTPVALDVFGLLGCTQYVAPVFVSAGIVGSGGIDAGYCAFDAQRILSATGATFAAQWLFLDPMTVSFATTKRHRFTLR